jgi:hypothetical protein
MDCASDIQPESFSERWDDTGTALFDEPAGFFSDLEKRCSGFWMAMRDAAQSRGEFASGSYRWLSRWITAFSHRAGTLLAGNFTFSSEIESIVKILSLEDPPDEDGLVLIEQIESDLWKMLDPDGQGTQISAFARLRGEWVKAKLKPRIDHPVSPDQQSIVLGLKLGDNSKVPLNALAFAWLKRRGERDMIPASFPLQYLETAGDALVKAASESHYYKAEDDVEMAVTLPDQRKLTLRRARGRVIINGI